MKLRNASFLLAVFSTAALAQTTGAPTLDEALVTSEGMTKVSDGLYAKSADSGQSFVATNKTGHQTLLQKLQAERSRIESRVATSSKQGMLDQIDGLISAVNQPSPKNQTLTGDCTGSGGTGYPRLYVQALSSGGTSASGYAVMTDDFSPYLNTTNYAIATTENLSNSATAHAFTPASASQTEPQSCYASATARVTCPPSTSPAITAVAFSSNPAPRCSA